jgi:hypothetical protein
MREQRLLVWQQLVQAAVERVLLHQPIIRAQKICHGALLEPLPVQAPLAAGIDQPIAHQCLQDVLPARALARIRQTVGPEAIEPKLLVQLTCQPARAPLPRPMQCHRVEPHSDAMRLGVFGKRAIGRKQRQLCVAASAFIKGFDLPAPSLMLAVVDLAQIEHLPLHHFATSAALALDNIPIAMFFAVFEASVEAQEHANQLTQNRIDEKTLSLHYRRFATTPL